MRHSAEAELVERARTDPAAFGRLYDQHYTAILSYLYRRTLSVETAEELTSNTFFKALRALPRYGHRSPFRAWLYRIATNELHTHWRRQRVRASSPDPEQHWEGGLGHVHFGAAQPEAPDEVFERMQRYARLHRAVAQLPRRYRDAVALRYFGELPYAEIAAVLGKRLGTAKSLVHRGLKKLRGALEE